MSLFCPVVECIRSVGPVWEDYSCFHCQFFAHRGHRKCKGALVVLGQLQWRRRRRHSCERSMTSTVWFDLNCILDISQCCFFSLLGGERALCVGAHCHDISRKPWQKHPAVQPELVSCQSVQLQPGLTRHCSASGPTAALPGNFRAEFHIHLSKIRISRVSQRGFYIS